MFALNPHNFSKFAKKNIHTSDDLSSQSKIFKTEKIPRKILPSPNLSPSQDAETISSNIKSQE